MIADTLGRRRQVRSTNSCVVGLAIAVLWPFAASSHPGGLDDYGCHHDHKAGDYHCHSGPFTGKTFASKKAMVSTAGQRFNAAPAPGPTLAEGPGTAATSGTNAARSAARTPSQEELARCPRIPHDKTRLACYDALFGVKAPSGTADRRAKDGSGP